MASELAGSEDGAALTLKINSLTPAEYFEGCCAVSALFVPAWSRCVRMVLIAVLCATFGYSIGKNGASLFAISACVVVALVVFTAIRGRIARRSLLAAYLRNFPLEITVDQNGLHSRGSSSEGRYDWKWFDGWKECKNVVVAYSQGHGVLFFPKRELAAQIDVLKKLFDTNIAK